MDEILVLEIVVWGNFVSRICELSNQSLKLKIVNQFSRSAI